MTDDVWTREEPESPCVKICVLHPETRLCIGCHRTIEEIAAWSALPPDQRRRIMAELPGRAPLVAPRRKGGRSGRLNARAAE